MTILAPLQPAQVPAFLGLPPEVVTEVFRRWPIPGHSPWPPHAVNGWANTHFPRRNPDPWWQELHRKPPQWMRLHWKEQNRRSDFIDRIQYVEGTGCWMWLGITQPRVSPTNGKPTAPRQVHMVRSTKVDVFKHLCAEYLTWDHQPIPRGRCLRNPERCVNPQHRAGARRLGQRKLTPEQVQAIRERGSSLKQEALAAQFGISRQAVSLIQRSRTYQDVA